jgi:hypothetical protein
MVCCRDTSQTNNGGNNNEDWVCTKPESQTKVRNTANCFDVLQLSVLPFFFLFFFFFFLHTSMHRENGNIFMAERNE